MWSLLHELHHAPRDVALLALCVLVATGLWTAFSRGSVPLLAMLLAAGFWLLTNTNMEGDILLSVAPTHGITSADFVAPLVIAVALMVRLRRRSAAGP